MNRRVGSALCTLLVLAVSFRSPAQEGEPDAKPSDESGQAETESVAEQLKQLTREVVLLREAVAEIHLSLQELSQSVVPGLIAENERLRESVRLRYSSPDGTLPNVPMPNRDLIEDVLAEGAPPGGPVNVEAADFSYSVVKEWGRSPEDAQRLGENVPSLMGLVLVVPEGGTPNDLTRLGRQLRDDYDAYDNINVEVFDNMDAAVAFAKDGTLDAPRRVLTVSRVRDADRDSISLYNDGVAVEAP